MQADTSQIPVSSAAGKGHSRLDGRTIEAQAVRRQMADFVAALGGPAAVDAVAMLRIERAVELSVTAKRLRTRALRGEPVDIAALVKIENAADRAMRDLGLDRQREPAGPSLTEYLANHHGNGEEGDAT